MSFIDRRRTKFGSRQQAVGAVTPNPPKAIARTGGGDQQDRVRPPSPPRRQQRGRNDGEKDQPPRDSRSKRSRDTSTSKDKTPESTRNTSVPSPQRRRIEEPQTVNRNLWKEPMSRTVEVPVPSWLCDGFQVPILQTELSVLAKEISNSAPPLSNLQLADPKVGRFLGVGALNRCLDPDMYRSISSMNVNDSIGHLGAYLSQVWHYTCVIFLCSI